MQIRDGIVEAIGHTPLIKLQTRLRGHRLHHPRQGRVHESGRLGEGSRRPADDPGGRKARRIASRRPGGGGDRRQHRHWSGLGRQCARLSDDDRHAADAERGKEGHVAAVRGRTRTGAGGAVQQSEQLPTYRPTSRRTAQEDREERRRSSPINGTIWTTARPITSPPGRRSGSRPTARSTASSAPSAPAARWPGCRAICGR